MTAGPIHEVLQLATWAPSGDNEQPWRFHIDSATGATVRLANAGKTVIYDYRGRASWIALGMLLETASIAATAKGYRLHWEWLPACVAEAPDACLRIELEPAEGIERDALVAAIKTRSVQRRALSSKPLSASHRTILEAEAAKAAGLEIVWMDSFGERLRMARLLWQNALVRLTAPEAYETHCKAIEWRSRFSVDRIPDQAIGLDAVTLKIMRWAMRRWDRVNFMNRYGGGTLLPRLQMDWWPAVRCAAHFVLLYPRTPQAGTDYVNAGRSLQRLWLAAEQLGVRLQPEFTPLVFDWYIREGATVSQVPKVQAQAQSLSRRMRTIWPDGMMDRAVFMGRVGYGPAATSRSLRQDLQSLQETSEQVASGTVS
jgi:nitroreductase